MGRGTVQTRPAREREVRFALTEGKVGTSKQVRLGRPAVDGTTASVGVEQVTSDSRTCTTVSEGLLTRLRER